MFLLIGYSNLVRLLLFISDCILNVLPIQHTFNFLKCILSTLFRVFGLRNRSLDEVVHHELIPQIWWDDFILIY
jgi:hypothetical protein